ncbi:hypothetical protein RHGRI_035989 [Rhododendron griersonianum]|uniref:RING-type domain-containing protein n=2 Tax=Rhododendron TaxID=4346 RepID=A0AAV6HPS2_9ERIC|nr:hypothetical protein RHGRI_035989 [Rhododendron griersonianum]KAG5514791.1 hypothetical protein RHGRI_035989 [Rhododendron griersonianum]
MQSFERDEADDFLIAMTTYMPSPFHFIYEYSSDRGDGKVINPNDPQANPTMFPNSTGTRTEPAADDQSSHQRHGARGGGSGGHPGRQGTGSADHSIDRSPLHPHHQKVMEKGSASPGGEGKNSYNSSHGGAGKSRMKPADQGDETPDRGAAVPKFGDWDEKNPQSADNYTGIFQRVRDERYNGPGKSPGRGGTPFSGTPRKKNTDDSTKEMRSLLLCIDSLYPKCLSSSSSDALSASRSYDMGFLCHEILVSASRQWNRNFLGERIRGMACVYLVDVVTSFRFFILMGKHLIHILTIVFLRFENIGKRYAPNFGPLWFSAKEEGICSLSVRLLTETHKNSMSTRGSRGPPLQGYVRNGRKRKMVLDVDLNVPPADNLGQEGTSAHSATLDVQNGQQRGSVPPVPIDVEAFDDDVVISSPRAFAEAKNNVRRSRQSTVLVDVDPDGGADRAAPSSRNKRRRVPANQAIINCDLYINLEGSSKPMRENVQIAEPSPPKPPKEPTFSCPICMGPLVEEMTTKCGHIFCKSCIKAAITVQGKCPTCRRKVTARDIHRVYLPTTN